MSTTPPKPGEAPPKLPADIIEHREVAEGRVINGHHMTFKASVYGEVISEGGTVHIEDVLGWGAAQSHGGQIKIKKRAFNSTIYAAGGTVQIDTAESCLIIGADVKVRQAINCKILAHKLRVAVATGCQIVARDIEISTAKPHKSEPTVVTIVAPDLPDLQPLIQPQLDEIAQTQGLIHALTGKIEALKANAALANYLVIRGKLRTGLVKLTEEQTQGYQLMEEKFAPSAKDLESAVAEKRPLAKTLTALQAAVEALQDERAALLADCRCRIAKVDGETIVRKTSLDHEDIDVSQLPGEAIPKIFIRNDASVKMVFSAAQGAVDWVAVDSI